MMRVGDDGEWKEVGMVREGGCGRYWYREVEGVTGW